MTDQIPAEIVGAETESMDYQHRGELRREYTTRITVVIKTPDLTRIDLTRPIEIHQENLPRMEWPGDQEAEDVTTAKVGDLIESADDPRIAALPYGSILLDRDRKTVTNEWGDWTGEGYKPIPSQGAEFGPWTVRRIPKEADQ